MRRAYDAIDDLQGSGATNMKLPPMGFPRPTSLAKELMLKLLIEVFAVTNVCLLKSAGWRKRRKT